jgi:hypothetical protein
VRGYAETMRHHRRPLVALTATVALCGTAACSEESRDALEADTRSVATDIAGAADELSEDAIELAARNFASTQARQEFTAAGISLDGDLSCRADAANDLTAVEITCTGTTDDGLPVELTGTTAELPGLSFDELNGDFVGTVDGEEVFTTERLGG